MPDTGNDNELEARVDRVEADMADVRILAAAAYGEVGDLGTKVETLRQAVNGLGMQTASGFAEANRRFDHVDRRFDQVAGRLEQVGGRLDRMDGRLEEMSGGMQHMTQMLTTLVEAGGSQ